MSKKKKYSPVFKTKVALSAIREEGTLSELSGRYGVNATMISKWKKQALDNMNSAFSG
jgi:transposase